MYTIKTMNAISPVGLAKLPANQFEINNEADDAQGILPYVHNRVLFVERSGELRLLARLSTIGTEPKGNQVLRGREVSKSRPETG